MCFFFFFNDTATTEIYTRSLGRQRQMCIRDRLNWNTATEINNYGFEVERSETQEAKSKTWEKIGFVNGNGNSCLLYTSPSPRDRTRSRMPSSA